MSSGIADLSFEISALHAAYEDGVEPQTIIAEVYRRIAAVDDPELAARGACASCHASATIACSPVDVASSSAAW